MKKLRLSLVFPPYFLQELYNLPPLGLIGLATCLKDTAHRMRIHDFVLSLRQGRLPMNDSLYEECAREVLAEDPDLVAFSAQCTTLPAALQIARILKQRNPKIQMVLGGHSTSVLDERLLTEFPFLDFVVRGEGEITFRELVQDLALGGDGCGVAGVTSRRGDTVVRAPERDFIRDLDTLPPADYGFVAPLREYKKACSLPRSIAVLEVGRGCPHQCIYCAQSVQWKRTPRTFSPERIVRDMAHLRDSSGAECFLLAYDQFTSRRGFVTEFCERVIDAGLDETPWYCISRLDTVDPDLLGLMRRAGCESMCYGIDSGSSRTLSFINKRIDRELLFQRVRETADQGIVSTLSFVIGFPEEELEDIDQTLLLSLQTGAYGNCDPLLQLPTVLPGTGLYEGYQERFVRAVDTYFSLGLEFEGGKRLKRDEQLIKSDPLVFSCFYNIPSPGLVPEDLESIAANFPLAIRFFPRSFLLVLEAMGQSPAGLFLKFCTQHHSSMGIDTEDFIDQFPRFLQDCLDSGVHGLDHIPEVIDYESISARMAQNRSHVFCTNARSPENPILRKDVMLKEFTYPVPTILENLKNGVFSETYAPHPVWLLFHTGPDGFEVTEINEFGKDFLGLCDGTRSLEEIARVLQGKYGLESDMPTFLELCREAEGGLKENHILETAVV